ncbi:ATP-dependent RNA helicase DbpA [Nannocystaceae bacterium ST9]
MNLAFASLPLSPAMLANLDALEWREMTPIQAAVLPSVLAGRDVIAQARTGSGKTAAFGLGLLARVDPHAAATQALVLCPTRELADQVGKQLRLLARAMPNLKLAIVCGGVPLYPQVASLRHGAHVVVGTPGRVAKHLRKGSLALDRTAVLVLDEGDRMLEMGFADEILAIVRTLPRERQTLLFSATYPEGIERISAAIQRDAQRIAVDEAHAAPHIEQIFYPVPHGQGPTVVGAWLKHHRPASTLVFCNTKAQCAALAESLNRQHIHALALHGDLEQADRDRVLAMFANHSCPVLVATDVAARGLDIADLEAVINFELPRDVEIYVHRIGRTGRAGATGKAASLFTPAQKSQVRAIEAFQNTPATLGDPADLHADPDTTLEAPMVTLHIRGGRRDKLGAGDILGALTSPGGVQGNQVGKIAIGDRWTHVAIERSVADRALAHLQHEPIKRHKYDVRICS